MFEFKPDYNEVFKRYEAWWNCEIIDRPLVSIIFPKPKDKQVNYPPEKKWENLRERWMDTDYILASTEAYFRNNVFFADSLPVAFPNLGPEIFSAFYGCDMIYGEDTAWSKPILDDWSTDSINNLKLDKNNFYYRKVMEMTDDFIAAGKNKFIVGYTDLHGGGDAIAAFRGSQNFLMDIITNPKEIKEVCDKITVDFLKVYDVFYEKLTAANMPSTSWCTAVCKGKFHIPSNDFSCMISHEDYENLFLPGIIDECRHMDKCIYHLDGPQALRYLDTLLEIPEIHAVQWVPGAGQEYWADWIEVYQRIQNKNKAMQILSVPAKDLDHLFDVLRPEGVWISNLTGITNETEAETALKKIVRWGK